MAHATNRTEQVVALTATLAARVKASIDGCDRILEQPLEHRAEKDRDPFRDDALALLKYAGPLSDANLSATSDELIEAVAFGGAVAIVLWAHAFVKPSLVGQVIAQKELAERWVLACPGLLPSALRSWILDRREKSSKKVTYESRFPEMKEHSFTEEARRWPGKAATEDVARWARERGNELVAGLGDSWVRTAEAGEWLRHYVFVHVFKTTAREQRDLGRIGLEPHNLALLYLAEERCSSGSSYRFPTALASGDSSIAHLFGKRLQDGVRLKQSSSTSVKIESGRVQMELGQKDLKIIEQPTKQQLLAALAEVLTNEEWLNFNACFALMAQDGRGDGTFLYNDSRLLDLRGYKRESSGKNGKKRHSAKRLERTRDSIKRLAAPKITLVFEQETGRVRRHQYVIKGLVNYDNADHIVELEHGAVRIVNRRMRIHPDILSLTDDRGYFMLSAEALRPPPGVDQRMWPDAFKVITLLAAHARNNARSVAKGDAELPFARRFEDILDDAGVCPPGRERWQGRRALRDILNVIGALPDGWPRIPNREDDPENPQINMIRYDVPVLRESLRMLSERDPIPRPARTSKLTSGQS